MTEGLRASIVIPAYNEGDDIVPGLDRIFEAVKLDAEVLCSDPYVTVDPDLVPLDDVVGRADLLVIGAPHAVYADLAVTVSIVDIWNLRNDGVRV